LARVERRLKHQWFIDFAGVGFDEAEVTRFWKSGETPDAFVERIADKYALISFDLDRP
jgi:hypothetical protein